MYTYLSKIIFNLSLFQFPNINQKLKNPNPPHSHHYYSSTTTITNNLCWRHQEDIRHRQLPATPAATHPPTHRHRLSVTKNELKKKRPTHPPPITTGPSLLFSASRKRWWRHQSRHVWVPTMDLKKNGGHRYPPTRCHKMNIRHGRCGTNTWTMWDKPT